MTTFFSTTNLSAQERCGLSHTAPVAKEFDCNQSQSALRFIVEFNRPFVSGYYGVYDGETPLGSTYISRGSDPSAGISSSCLDCHEDKVQINAYIYTQVAAGIKTLTLKPLSIKTNDHPSENETCSVDFDVNFTACKGIASITEKKAECVENLLDLTAESTINNLSNKVPRITMTIQAGDDDGGPSALIVYYRYNGEDIYMGSAYENRFFTEGRTLSISRNLPSDVHGDILFTVVNRQRRIIVKPRPKFPLIEDERELFTLDPDDFFVF